MMTVMVMGEGGDNDDDDRHGVWPWCDRDAAAHVDDAEHDRDFDAAAGCTNFLMALMTVMGRPG